MEILGHKSVLQYFCEGLKRSRLSPSLLFIGPEGVGKRAAALELAKCFLCSESNLKYKPEELPRCDKCAACVRAGEFRHPDLLLIDRNSQALFLNEKPETQTAVKIEAIRQINQFLQLKPLEGRRRVVIVDEAHKMTQEAANALLKTLEEPPVNSQIVLIGTDEHSFPNTVVSRCAVLRFRPLPSGVLARWLEKEQGMDPEQAALVADRSGGSFSKALAAEESADAGIDLGDYNTGDFFDLVGQINWKKDGRKNVEKTLAYLIERSRRKLESGDLAQEQKLEKYLKAHKQLQHNVSPRLVLENLYMTLTP